MKKITLLEILPTIFGLTMGAAALNSDPDLRLLYGGAIATLLTAFYSVFHAREIKKYTKLYYVNIGWLVLVGIFVFGTILTVYTFSR